MANLQYIGARYVPKFYLNPDDGSNDWKSGVLYEALTIVTYNNDSYTSRVTVPDGVGNPADNPTYWACTTKYTAALVALQSTVGQHETQLEKIDYKVTGFVTPEEFGAVGDGTTDDTGAIQLAINTRKPVFFSNKTYKVSCANVPNSYALLVNDGAMLVGAEGATIKMDDSITIGRIINKTNSSVKVVMISNINFKGNCSSATNDETGLCAITLVYGSGCITNCKFDGFNKNVELTECEFVTVANNEIKNATETANLINGYGVLIEGGHNIEIFNNLLDNIERHAIYVNLAENVNILNNVIHGQTTDLARFSHYEGNIKVCGAVNVNIESNIITGNYYGILILKPVNTDVGVTNLTVRNNKITGMIYNSGFGWGGVGLDTDNLTEIYNVDIDNNYIENGTTGARHGIFFSRSVDTMHDLKIRNNHIVGFPVGVNLMCVDSVEMSNNKVEDCNVGYEMSATFSMSINGDENYYHNCTTPANFTSLSLRFSRVKPFLDSVLNSDGLAITGDPYTADPILSKSFIATGTCNVTSIKPSTQGDVVVFKSGIGGAPTFKAADVDTRIILNGGDFTPTAGSYIIFKRIDLNWCEITRNIV